MKILITGDQHWTDKCPRNRTDNYYFTLTNKVKWEIDTAMRNDCEAIIFPGDVFDTYKVPYNVVRDMITIMRWVDGGLFPLKCLYTFGQHDVRYHTTDVSNTPLGVLLAATNGVLLGAHPTVIADGVHVYGAGWGEDVPTPTNETACNIIATHRMVIGDSPLWEGQTDYVTAASLLEDPRFDLWACGDNHQRVIASTLRHKHVVNMGSMMRSTTAQLSHVPGVCIYDTETRNIEIIDIPVRDADSVFKVDELVENIERDQRIAEFVESLKAVDVSSTDFSAALERYVRENPIDDAVLDVINKITNKETYHG